MELSKAESLRQARQHIAEGRVSAAMSIYQKIVDADPLDLAAISMLGDLYVKAGRVPAAVEHFLRISDNFLRSGSAVSATYILKKVLKIDPTNAVAHMNMGELHFQEKKIESAHDAFIEAGAGFWHTGDKTAAIRMNRRALEVMPSSRHARAALALIKQEMDQPETPEPKKAIACDLPEIMISIPDDTEAGCAPWATGDNQAQPNWTSHSSDSASQAGSAPARDVDPTIEQIATAELLVGCGHVDRAIALLRDSLQDNPDHIQLREKLKDIYLRSELIDRASEECVNIAAIYSARGERSRAADYVMRARLLRSSVDPDLPQVTIESSSAKEPEGAQETLSEWDREPGPPITLM